MIMLNCYPGWLFDTLWAGAKFRVCADGGSNQVFDLMQDSGRALARPDLIIGDMDSIRPSVGDYWAAQGSELLRIEDQDTTDLEKALMFLLGREGYQLGDGQLRGGRGSTLAQAANKLQHLEATEDIDSVVIYGPFTGRFDHMMASIHALYELQQHAGCRLLLLSEGTVLELLMPGKHEIRPNSLLEPLGTHCGLLPYIHVDRVATEGLKWDLTGQAMDFRSLISTSNLSEDSTITVETSQPIVWCSSFAQRAPRHIHHLATLKQCLLNNNSSSL
jgi:thiamine pyrophosphokinase